MEFLFLIIAIGAGFDYGLFRAWKEPSWDRTLTKSTATMALLIWAVLISAPSLVIIAMGFAVIGDYAVSRSGLNWLVVGATAFFAVHCIYMIEYVSLVNQSPLEAGPAIMLATFAVGALILCCWREFASHWLASIMFGTIMLAQFSLGQMVGDAMQIIGYTTCLFLISGLILGLELFLVDISSIWRRILNPAIWYLYMTAQIFTVIALTDFSGM